MAQFIGTVTGVGANNTVFIEYVEDGKRPAIYIAPNQPEVSVRRRGPRRQLKVGDKVTFVSEEGSRLAQEVRLFLTTN